MSLHPVLIPIPSVGRPRSPEAVVEQRRRSRAALAICAARSGAPADGWIKDPGEAPLPNATFHWSVSHTRGWAAAVIGEHPVGIDVEAVRPRADHLFAAVGDEDEWQRMGGRTWENFYRLWTGKEAVLKAERSGIGEIRRCRLSGAVDHPMRLDYRSRLWEVVHLVHDGHVFAVTSHGGSVEWVFPPQAE